MSTSKESENLAIYSIRTMDFDASAQESNETPNSEISQNDTLAGYLSDNKAHLADDSESEDELPTAHRFKQESMLGSGAYGEVWLAQDQMVERPVAVKQLVKKDSVVLENVKREASLGARVAHPGTPTIYDVGLDENGQFRVIMEYME